MPSQQIIKGGTKKAGATKAATKKAASTKGQAGAKKGAKKR